MPNQASPHAQHLRSGRYSEPGRIYLLTSVIHAREPLLVDLYLARLLIRELSGAEADGLADSLAWVVMPDHLHWLIRLADGNLDNLMRRIKARSSLAINRHCDRRGRLWQDGYHDHALRHEDELKGLARALCGG